MSADDRWGTAIWSPLLDHLVAVTPAIREADPLGALMRAFLPGGRPAPWALGRRESAPGEGWVRTALSPSPVVAEIVSAPDDRAVVGVRLRAARGVVPGHDLSAAAVRLALLRAGDRSLRLAGLRLVVAPTHPLPPRPLLLTLPLARRLATAALRPLLLAELRPWLATADGLLPTLAADDWRVGARRRTRQGQTLRLDLRWGHWLRAHLAVAPDGHTIHALRFEADARRADRWRAVPPWQRSLSTVEVVAALQKVRGAPPPAPGRQRPAR